MKKTMLLGALMLVAAAGYAQESRQDASVSAIGCICSAGERERGTTEFDRAL